MSQELQLGKYTFYPHEFDKSETPTLDDLKNLLKKRKNEKRKSSRSNERGNRER